MKLSVINHYVMGFDKCSLFRVVNHTPLIGKRKQMRNVFNANHDTHSVLSVIVNDLKCSLPAKCSGNSFAQETMSINAERISSFFLAKLQNEYLLIVTYSQTTTKCRHWIENSENNNSLTEHETSSKYIMISSRVCYTIWVCLISFDCDCLRQSNGLLSQFLFL